MNRETLVREMLLEAVDIIEKTAELTIEVADRKGWDRDELFIVVAYIVQKASKESTLKETEETPNV